MLERGDSSTTDIRNTHLQLHLPPHLLGILVPLLLNPPHRHLPIVVPPSHPLIHPPSTHPVPSSHPNRQSPFFPSSHYSPFSYGSTPRLADSSISYSTRYKVGDSSVPSSSTNYRHSHRTDSITRTTGVGKGTHTHIHTGRDTSLSRTSSRPTLDDALYRSVSIYKTQLDGGR